MTPLYAGIGGVVRELTEMDAGINGVVTPLTEMWAGIDGVQRQIFSGGPQVGDLVRLNVNGSPFDFLVVHQGLPSSMYDSSCDGTWLLMNDVYDHRLWSDTRKNVYANSAIFSYLNNEFLSMFDANVQSAIKKVKLPYVNGTGGSSVSSGSNGLPCKIFLLSGYEVGWTQSDNQNFPVDGAKLSYFISGTSSSANSKRIANYNGSANNWWTRSPPANSTINVWGVGPNGGIGNYQCYNTRGVRPCLILPKDFVL